jgi:hypothetical protein
LWPYNKRIRYCWVSVRLNVVTYKNKKIKLYFSIIFAFLHADARQLHIIILIPVLHAQKSRKNSSHWHEHIEGRPMPIGLECNKQ